MRYLYNFGVHDTVTYETNTATRETGLLVSGNDGERFMCVDYVIKNDTLMILAQENGILSIDIDNIPNFIEELKEMYETFERLK